MKNERTSMNIDRQNRCRRAAVILTALILALLFMCVGVYADEAEAQAETKASRKVEGYELQQYDMNVKVNKDHSYDVQLNLHVNIPAEDFQTLTVRMPNGNYRIMDVYVEGNSSQMVSDSIGSRLLITGPDGAGIEKGTHDYSIHYRIVEYAEHNTSRDMFYFDAVEPDWDVPINDLKITLELPEDFVWDDLRYYAGQFGVQDVTGMLEQRTEGSSVILTGSKLPQNFGITFKAQLPDGYWEGALDNSWTLNASILMMLGIFTAVFLMWVIGGRDPKVKREPEYRPIEGVSPVDVGYLFNGRTRIRDIIILLVDLAAKGCLRIVEYEPKQYRLIRLEEPKNEARYIRAAYNTLFEDVYEGRAIEMNQIESRLRKLRSTLEASIESGYSAEDMRACTKLSQTLRIISIILISAGIGAVYALSQIYLYQDVNYATAVLLVLASAASLYVMNRQYDSRYESERETFLAVFLVSVAVYAGILGLVAYRMGRNSGLMPAALLIGAFGLAAMFMTLVMKARAKGNAELVSRIMALRQFMMNSTIRDLAPLIVEGEEEDTYYRELQAYAMLFSIEEIWGQKFRWLRAASPYYYEEEIEGNAMSSHVSEKSMAAIARELRTFIRTIEGEYHKVSRRRRA